MVVQAVYRIKMKNGRDSNKIYGRTKEQRKSKTNKIVMMWLKYIENDWKETKQKFE